MQVSLILPLAAPGTYTYQLPAALERKVEAGMRAIVPFGARRYYTGIIIRVDEAAAPEGLKLKEVADLPDEKPVVLPAQLDLWRWLCSYYMCTPGEVMKAALPSGLKLESESYVTRNPDFDTATAHLPSREIDLLNALLIEKGRTVAEVEKELRTGNLLPAVRRLMEIGAVKVSERMGQGFRPKTETHVRLAKAFFNEQKLNTLFDELHRAPKQAQLLLKYLEMAEAPAALRLRNPQLLAEVAKQTLLLEAMAGEAAFSALRAKGVFEVYPYETGRLKQQPVRQLLKDRPLGEQQARAVEEITEAFRAKGVCLLHGVTSSGKTEVFMRLIERELAAGRQVLYLLPEIALTTQITSRLGRVFGDRMGVYHSKFPDTERVELWHRQLSDRPFSLILGVRSSLFLPFRNLGLIIVDEEHEQSYKQQDPAPRYNARDAAIYMGHALGCKVLLGTATPSLESYHNALAGKYALVEMPERYGGVQMPLVVVEDVKELRRKKLMKSPFSPRLTEEIRMALENKEQVILFQNRRGYAPVVECRTCGWTPRCTRCDVSLTLHRGMNKLVCHYCGTAYDVPRQCPNCADTELRDMGYGTEKIEQAVNDHFPTARTARMDLDTTRSRAAYEKLIEAFQRGETDILIGTQMVTKGLDFDRVRVVGIINADQMLNVPDFRAFERAFQMMSQVAGRAGRRNGRGLVVLQTRQPELTVVQQVVDNDYLALYHTQMAEREMFHYAPFYRMIDIYLKHRDERVADMAARQLATILAPHFGDDLLGPDRPPVGRIQLLFIRKLVLKVRPGLPPSGVRRTLGAARDLLLKQEAYKSLQVVYDVDPM